MKTETIAIIIKKMGDLAGRQLKADTIDLYYHALKKYSDNDVKAAAVKIVSTYHFKTFPPPALFIESMGGTIKSKALEAWQKRNSDDPLIMKALNCCDPILPETTNRELVWIRKQFLETYENLSSKSEYFKQGEQCTIDSNIKGLIDNVNKKPGDKCLIV